MTSCLEKEQGRYQEQAHALFRLCLAAGCGALCALLPLFAAAAGVRAGKAILLSGFAAGAVLMLLIAFGRDGFLKRIPAFLLTAALLGGALTAFPVGRHAVLLSGMALFLAKLLQGFLKKLFYEQNIKKHLCTVILEFAGKQIKAEGLLDTGNRLKDPYGRKPVIIAAEELLSDSLETAKLFYPERFVLIPYTSLGGSGILQGVRLNQVVLITPETKTVHTGVVAACGRKELFAKRPYRVILHTELLQ